MCNVLKISFLWCAFSFMPGIQEEIRQVPLTVDTGGSRTHNLCALGKGKKKAIKYSSQRLKVKAWDTKFKFITLWPGSQDFLLLSTIHPSIHLFYIWLRDAIKSLTHCLFQIIYYLQFFKFLDDFRTTCVLSQCQSLNKKFSKYIFNATQKLWKKEHVESVVCGASS